MLYLAYKKEGDNMKKYLLCLDKNYDIELSNHDEISISILEGIIDNLIYLLRSYGIDEQEILEQFEEQTEVAESEV